MTKEMIKKMNELFDGDYNLKESLCENFVKVGKQIKDSDVHLVLTPNEPLKAVTASFYWDVYALVDPEDVYMVYMVYCIGEEVKVVTVSNASKGRCTRYE